MEKHTAANVASKTKLFLSCEHAGNLIPARYKKLFAKNQGVLQTHRGSDPGAFVIAKILARETKTKLHFTKISRLIVDMNRSTESTSLFSRWTKTLPANEQRRILDKIYWPYRKSVRRAVASAFKSTRHKNVRILHFGIHSFSPYLDKSRLPCDIGILFDPKSDIEKKAASLLCDSLRRLFPDLGIYMNFPFRGDADGLTTDLRIQHQSKIRGAGPKNPYAGLEIEFNQAFLRKLKAKKSTQTFSKAFALCLSSLLTEV